VTVQRMWSTLKELSVRAVVIALVAGLVGAFIGANYERTRPSVFESRSILLLDNAAAITSEPGAVLAVSEDRVKYTGLVATDVIAVPVSESLGVSRGQASAVQAVADPTSLDIAIVARGSSPEKAQALSNAAGKQLVKYVTDEQAALTNVSASLRLKMSVLSPAGAGVRVSPTHRKELTTGVIVGVILALATYVVVQLAVDADRRRKAPRRAVA
jgi:capsular polysaccharide biosynthesis protein